MELATPITHVLESEPNPALYHISMEKSNHDNSNCISVPNDVELPISLRKGVRTCSTHPIGNFESYNQLSPPYKAFMSTATEYKFLIQ